MFGQQRNYPLNWEWSLEYEKNRKIIQSQPDKKTSTTDLPDTIQDASCFKPYIVSIKTPEKDTSRSLFIRKLKKESLFIIRDTADKFLLAIDPLFTFEYGKDQFDSYYKNTRGVLFRGDIGSGFSFESSFYENQATFVEYIKKFNDTYLVVPGQGRWKKFKENGYDFAMASGYISYSPGKHFNFQVGHGKHFVGDGYRSLLLSDNAFNYPFARITSTFGKVQYTNVYAVLMNLTDGGVNTPPGTERLFQKKAASFQFLNWNIHKQMQLALFQGLIWQASDTMNRQHLNLAYASPVIYTAAISEGLAGSNNVLLGATLKLKITRTLSMYGQYMLDETGLGSNEHLKNGIQIGIKYFDVATIKNLHLQLEVNGASPYAYSAKDPAQSYSHYNQALAHPLGSNFNEGIALLNYRIGDFFTQLKINYANTGIDYSNDNYGNNIFLSDTSNIPIGYNWSERQLTIYDFQIGYLINPSTNLNIIAGISNRSSVSPIENSQTNFMYFGIRTSLTNVYYDF